MRGIRGLPTPIPADLSHQAMPDQANHKVDGGTAVPAVPFAGLIALGLMLAGIPWWTHGLPPPGPESRRRERKS